MVTVIIPTRPELREIKALTGAQNLDYPREKLEIIVVRGRQPSVQRNQAIKAAVGEIVYFLDDDSVPEPANLRRALEHFRDPAVQIVGGPNLCPPDAPPLERAFAAAMGNRLAFGPSVARYRPVGAVRRSGEKELILCNMLARRAALLERGGFDESLYPNEENALLDELQRRHGKLIYDPQLVVHRRPRPTLKAFCRMLRTYGRGRAEQFRRHPTPGSIANFAPPLFFLYLLLLPFLLFANGSGPAGPWLCAPLLLYFLVLAIQTCAEAARLGLALSLSAIPFVFLTHALYGMGFWIGLFTRFKTPDLARADVRMEIVR